MKHLWVHVKHIGGMDGGSIHGRVVHGDVVVHVPCPLAGYPFHAQETQPQASVARSDSLTRTVFGLAGRAGSE